MPQGKTIYVVFNSGIDDQKVNQLISVCSQLVNQQKPETLYFCFASPGGYVAQGIILHNFLRSLPVKIVMHNIGSVDSIGNVIFLAGSERYANPHSSFLFHGVNANFNEKSSLTNAQLNERVSGLEQDQTKITNIITQYTKITKDELNNLFMQGEVKDPSFALDKGFISEIKPLSIPQNELIVPVA